VEIGQLKPAADRTVRTLVATLSLMAALLFGGMAVGLAVAIGPGGGSVGAIIVGFFALPLCFGLGMTAGGARPVPGWSARSSGRW
jgi:hypothetical protein